jgi:hypothetical protein
MSGIVEIRATQRGLEKQGEGGEPMAELAFEYEEFELSEALANIGELKNVISHSVLEEKGFTNVVHTPSEVAGDRNGCRVSILHLHIADRNFWQVVMCSCDGGSHKANAMVGEVVDAIHKLVVL